jgi:hypothetical protein
MERRDHLRQSFVQHVRSTPYCNGSNDPINRGRELFTTRRAGVASGNVNCDKALLAHSHWRVMSASIKITPSF